MALAGSVLFMFALNGGKIGAHNPRINVETSGASVAEPSSSTPEKMNTVPSRTPVIEPKGLKAWEKLRRRFELRGSPNCAIKGFEAVSRKDNPPAIIKRAKQEKSIPADQGRRPKQEECAERE